MAKVFLGLAIALMIATAVVGFLAKGNIDAIQGNLKDTKATLVTATSNLKKKEGEVKAAQDELVAAKAAMEEEKTSAAKAKAEMEEAVKKAATAATEVEDKVKLIAEKQAQIDAMAGQKGLDPEQVKIEREKMESDLRKAQTELAESKQVQETLNQRVKDAEQKYSTQTGEIERYRKGFAKNSLSGRVMAVNPGWNFVVLSVGDRQGAAVGATMLVMRGGEAIGKAKISSVEPSTSIADLVPGSVRKGITVQPGDTVVYEGQRK